MQKSCLLFVFMLFTSFLSNPCLAQDEEKAAVDKGHGGIGLEINKPNFGKYSGAESNWYGINVLSDMFEVRLLLGKIGINPSREPGLSDTKLPEPAAYGENYFGSNLSMGLNVPISVLGFGAEAGYLKTFRVHPFVGIQLGAYSFWPRTATLGDKDWYAYLGLRPGMRARLPFVTVDAVLNIEVGMYSGEVKKPFRAFNIGPSFVIRLNGQKQLFNMKYREAAISQFNIKNGSTSTSTSSIRSGNVKTTTTTTTSNYEVEVKQGTTTVQDIGALIAIGPVVSISNPRRYDFQSRSMMYGGNLTFKKSIFYSGLNFMVGNMGHGSEMEDPDSKRKGIERREYYGMGSYGSAFVGYLDIGTDISPIFLALMGTARGDIGDATPYFSLMAGFSLGVSNLANQSFENQSAANAYDIILAKQSNKDIPAYRLDPREAGFGPMGGWWIGVDVGVVSFKMQTLNHRNAPLASNRYFSLAYKIPLVKE